MASQQPPQTVEALRESLRESLECAICAEPMRAPTSIACGHSFCIDCLRMHLRRKAFCPLCRTPCNVDPHPNIALGEVLGTLFPETLVPREPEAEAERRTCMLPVFLSTSVAFPSGVSQLHLFEPRYRKLARTARDGTGEFAIICVVDGAGFPLRVDPDSLVGLTACIMKIEHHRTTPDGRWLLYCRGSGRAVVKEAWDEPDAAAMTLAVLSLVNEAEAGQPVETRHLS